MRESTQPSSVCAAWETGQEACSKAQQKVKAPRTPFSRVHSHSSKAIMLELRKACQTMSISRIQTHPRWDSRPRNVYTKLSPTLCFDIGSGPLSRQASEEGYYLVSPKMIADASWMWGDQLSSPNTCWRTWWAFDRCHPRILFLVAS